MLRPSDILYYTDAGTGNIAVTCRVDRESYVLSFLRIHFVGGTGSASVTIGIDAESGSQFDTTLWTLPSKGTGADVNFRVPQDELKDWVYFLNQSTGFSDKTSVAWTNPDSGNMSWGLTVGYAKVADVNYAS